MQGRWYYCGFEFDQKYSGQWSMKVDADDAYAISKDLYESQEILA